MRLTPLALAALGLLALPACDSGGDTQTATATVAPPPGVTSGGISGTVTLTQDGDDLTMRLALTGATPGEHGFHIHTVGTCAPADLPEDADTNPDPAGAALGHYDPLSTANHGGPSDADAVKHAADFGNVTAGADGTISTTVTTTEVSLSGERTVVGRAVMVHAGRDDLTTDPGGASGARVGCGVIGAATTTDG